MIFISIEKIKNIFRAVNACEAWSLQLLKISDTVVNVRKSMWIRSVSGRAVAETVLELCGITTET